MEIKFVKGGHTMKHLVKKGYEKYKKYLYSGLFTGGLAFVMLVIAVMSSVSGEEFRIQLTGYLAAVMWCVTAFLMIRVYYAAKKAAGERLDDKDNLI